MRFGKARIPDHASFDLTPMVDVVLLLIIFFMFTAQFARTQLSELDLPREPGDKSKAHRPTELIIDMKRTGQLSVHGMETDLQRLTRMVESEVLRVGEALDVTIRAERECPALHLNRLAESLAGIGVRNWKLATSSGGT